MTLITRLARLVVLASVVALGACKPASEAPRNSVSSADGVLRDGSLSYAPEDYREAAPGKPGGTLRISTASDTTTLDVHSISHGNVQWLGRILFDCLLYQDEQGNISPWLAKSWDISPDGKTYTFHLRDDVTFSDGEKFNARAVQINLEHMRDPATKSPLAAAYIAPYVNGRIVDEYTFEAHLREPYSPFLDVLAQSWLSMISPRQILEAPKSIAEHAIGSGPFVLESYTRDQGATFVRRKGYNWAPPVTRHNGEAYLDRLELSIVPEPMIRFSALESGQSDFTVDAPAQNARAIRSNPDLQMSSRIRKANPFRSLTFNVEQFPFQDVQVRRAVAKAIDRDGLAWITGFGEYQPKGDFLAANTRYYDPAFKDVLAYDVAEANRILDQAGWSERDARGYRVKDGQRLSARLLMYETGAFPGSVAVAIQADLKKVGFELAIDLLPLAQVTERRYASNFQAIAGGYWHTNTPDGLYILYHSNAISTPELIGQNAGRFRDDALDAALSAARRSTDPVELAALYRTAQQRLVETVPAVPVYESHVLVAYRKAVKGVIFDTSHNTPFFTSIWLDQEAR
ncbi:ABC transporter substrate-binding protein [Pseudomonas putida]|uniref:Peptide/nickel transport system substrate-binding protein n=1 Tax=Pseudomonas putida TaxID=303 RepID=A0A9X8HK51_PSEPU|nr:ABC transporter substrate-binding protein [Pseudomonas putida]ROQ53749.1 peptide/nickel transport system substrate-binding protein [Pseudomonas putida]